ncbi:putative NADH dehydrogenase [Hypsibius exemplaris]|uniref:NADH dehydrogenase n=1 Tax=Hypsibius exemplaris TaxID=2072580 RepID=A0A1W0WF99_HYPEX|nr:putative NADH dehydrogenase [Hypsibius exemplaris]
MHSSRYLWSWNAEKKVEGLATKRLVILGTGWASYSLLKNLNRKLYHVTVISPRNHFLFTPLLASTTVGTLEFRSIIDPVRNAGFGEKDDFYLSYATKINLDQRTVQMRSNDPAKVVSEVPYDRLVIGVGALTNTFNVPGAETHAFFLKEILDAQKIRNKILSNFESALQPGLTDSERQRLLHIVIVGGGPTGVEFGAEVYDFVRQDVARLYKKDAGLIQVTLVEAQHILQSFDQNLQNYAHKKMSERKNFHLLQDSVVKVTENWVELKSGQVIPCGMVVWSTGLAPRDLVRELNVPKNKAGQIVVNRHMQLVEDPLPEGSVFSIGDCSFISEQPLPCTAQVAEREGRYLAKLLNQSDIRTAAPFTFTSMGMLAYVGGYKAVSDLPELKIHGITSWLLWRSAYLTRLGSLRLRLQVPFDWFKTFFFGRDTSKL